MSFSEQPIGPIMQAMDKIVPRYPTLEDLLRSDPQARRYYDELPDQVRERISDHASGISSLDKLKSLVENPANGNEGFL